MKGKQSQKRVNPISDFTLFCNVILTTGIAFELTKFDCGLVLVMHL